MSLESTENRCIFLRFVYRRFPAFTGKTSGPVFDITRGRAAERGWRQSVQLSRSPRPQPQLRTDKAPRPARRRAAPAAASPRAAGGQCRSQPGRRDGLPADNAGIR